LELEVMELTKRYKAYSLRNYRDIPQVRALSSEQHFAMETVAHVFPFKTNNYVVDELVDWDNIPRDPLFVLNFPQEGMLRPEHFGAMAHLMRSGAGRTEITDAANAIRWQLDPHPSSQMDKNVPHLDGEPLPGIQHKYRQTVLFFPSQGQTCHAYCTFCFRWPQFVGIEELRFSARSADALVEYVRRHPEVTDILFTGGDPLVMKSWVLGRYVQKILDAGLPHVRTIRFGTKSLAYWPYRFLSDDDAPELLDIFRKIVRSGRQVAFMAHFNHPRELETQAVRDAIGRLRETGAVIRTQSPLLRHINDDPALWSRMWTEQARLGLVPYYMFVVRDTGAQQFFGVPLVRAWEIFREAYRNVSGVARTVRGPSMSADPGKVQVLGVADAGGEKVMVLRMLQARRPGWVQQPFFARYDDRAIWLDDLEPAFGEERFFFEDEPSRLRILSFG
jgi:KamA family protein